MTICANPTPQGPVAALGDLKAACTETVYQSIALWGGLSLSRNYKQLNWKASTSVNTVGVGARSDSSAHRGKVKAKYSRPGPRYFFASTCFVPLRRPRHHVLDEIVSNKGPACLV